MVKMKVLGLKKYQLRIPVTAYAIAHKKVEAVVLSIS